MLRSKLLEILGVLVTSGRSDLAKIIAEPSDAQKKAGNYKKTKRKFNGLDISIENPKGSFRKGTDPDGKEWKVELKHHYGYIKGTVGRDKDHVDVFIDVGAKEDAPVYVVNQNDPKTQKFDEHKCMLGFTNEGDAKKAYLANYEKNWKGLGNIVCLSIKEFKDWVFKGKKNNPLEIKVK